MAGLPCHRNRHRSVWHNTSSAGLSAFVLIHLCMGDNIYTDCLICIIEVENGLIHRKLLCQTPIYP